MACYDIILPKGEDLLTFWQNVLRIMDASMETPGLYGWFHLLSLILTVAGTVFLCIRMKEASAKSVRMLILITTVTVLILEVYKQINYSFSYQDGIHYDYQWYAFPFQFCSTPMYVGLVMAFTKQGRVHEACSAYLATYALFAGICVMLYPATVFIDTIGINIQTMICHGSMIVVGICLLVCGYVKLEHKTILKALPVFSCLVVIAMFMNSIAKATGLLERETFNMFFISPYCEPSLPVYSIVQQYVPYPLCLIIYVAGFTLASYLILLAAMGIRSLSRKVFFSEEDTAVTG